MAEYEAFSSEPANVALVPCSVCSRTFMPEALVKHEKICSKTSNSKRKVFQSGKQRAQGSDIPITNVLKSGAPPPSKSIASKKSNWREKHEQLVEGLRAARGVQNAIAAGKPLPPPPPPAVNPDYVQCPSCQRRFNPTAAERHIPFCKEKNKRLPDKKTVDPTAQRRKDARVNYKTAKPKIKGREDTMYEHTIVAGNGVKVNGYSAPMRTGRSERNEGLNTRSGSMDRRKSSGEQRKSGQPRASNHHDSQNGHMAPAPPGAGRPPSGLAYQHRSREGSARSIGSGDSRGRQQTIQAAGGSSKFCHECGNKYCRYDAKFCCECGCRRMVI